MNGIPPFQKSHRRDQTNCELQSFDFIAEKLVLTIIKKKKTQKLKISVHTDKKETPGINTASVESELTER